jgi:hypothetical protein
MPVINLEETFAAKAETKEIAWVTLRVLRRPVGTAKDLGA